MARILILGGGFAALSAAERLARDAGSGDEIVLVSKTEEFTFYPAIVPMVFGNFDPDEIRFDLRPKLAERNIRFIKGEILAVNTESRTVEIQADGISSNIEFDYLLVAVGRKLLSEVVQGLYEHSHSLLSVEAALKFKAAVSAFRSGAIVVGLCPDTSLPVPIFESALGLANKFGNEIKRGEASVTVVVPQTLDRALAGAGLFRNIQDEFARKGIRLVENFRALRVDQSRLVSENGEGVDYDLLLLMPAFGGQLSLQNLEPVTDSTGFARVNARMQVTGINRVYAAGEIVSMSGPKFGYIALRQGKVAAENILSELAGRTPAAEYVHRQAWVIGEKYTDPVFFHYGVWDETLDDYDDNALFGLTKLLRAKYGRVSQPQDTVSAATMTVA